MKPEKCKKNNNKPSKKEKVAMALFMSCLPRLIALWEARAPEKTFDAFLWDVYEEHEKGGA